MKTILLAKPNWNTINSESHWNYWNKIRECCSDHNVIEFDTPCGIRGAHYIQKNKHKYEFDILISHHASYNDNNIIDYKQAYYPHMIYFDNGGYSGFSNITRDDIIDTSVSQKKVSEFCEEYVYVLRDHTKYEELNLAPLENKVPDEFILVALQVPNDSVMALARQSSRYMIQAAISTGKHMKLPVVVKFHPMGGNNRDDTELFRFINQERGKGFPIYTSKGDVKLLLSRARAVFTINSGVGFEALINHKPVFTFGECDYNHLAHFNCTTPAQVQRIIEAGPNIKRYERFFYSWWDKIIDINHPNHMIKIRDRIDVKLQS